MSDRTYDVLDQPDVLAVAFHPRRQAFADPRPDGRDVRVPVAEGVAVGGRLHVAAAEAPLILFFHGNGELAAEWDDVAPLYRDLGISLLAMDYRGYGASDGEPTATNLIADALAVWRGLPAVLAEQDVRPARVFVMGRSLGSAAAVAIADAADDGLAGLILESGFVDTFGVIRRLGGPEMPDADEARDGFDHLGKLARITIPTLIIHGQADWIIPVTEAHLLHRHCAAADKRLLIIPAGDHNSLLVAGRDEYFQAIGELVLGG